jgi:hypothetical protein
MSGEGAVCEFPLSREKSADAAGQDYGTAMATAQPFPLDIIE